MTDSVILREYLVSLGFKVQKTEVKKFIDGLDVIDKTAVSAGKAILGIAAATAAAVGVYAAQMEKMYYASQRIGASVGSIKALKFGAEQIGVSGERMQGALEGIAASMRSNPGLISLVQSFGIPVKGRTMDVVAKDLIEYLNSKPTAIAERLGSMFHIDPTDLYMLRLGWDEMRQAEAERKKAAADLGVDEDKAAVASKELMNTWRGVMMYVGLFEGALVQKILPYMQDWAKTVKDILRYFTQMVNNWDSIGTKDNKIGDGGASWRGEQKKLPWQTGTPATNNAAAAVTSPQNQASKSQAVWDQAQKASGGSGSAGGSSSLFSALEAKYSLPPGLLDRVWARESGRGKYMLSKAGAKGHFGFMDNTAKAYGVSDPNDLAQSAEGSAHMWADLLKQYKGDLRMAAAAYNWGSGRIAEYGLGKAPKETREYMNAISGSGVQQTVNITVNGAGDARSTADAIASAQRAANADLVRKL